MGERHHLDFKWTEGARLAQLHDVQRRLAVETAFAQLLSHKIGRERRRIDRCAELGP